jgi:hypothetical protein
MKFQKNPVVILSIDQTLFNTELFKEQLTYTNNLDDTGYIELLYLTEKKVFQELVLKRDIPINIFSTRKELLIKAHALNDTEATKRLKDYLEDYKNYQIYFVGDQCTQLTEAKKFNENIVTIWLQTKEVNGNANRYNSRIDNIVHQLEEIISIILSKSDIS